MTQSFEKRLQSVDRAMLTPLVSRTLITEVFDSINAKMVDFSETDVKGGMVEGVDKFGIPYSVNNRNDERVLVQWDVEREGINDLEYIATFAGKVEAVNISVSCYDKQGHRLVGVSMGGLVDAYNPITKQSFMELRGGLNC